MKENANLLDDSVRDILNCSFSEVYLPPSWKEQAKDVNKDLPPISLKPVLTKITEEFVVEEHVQPAMLQRSMIANSLF